MTDHLAAAIENVRAACTTSDVELAVASLAAAICHLVTHLEAQQTPAPDPLDETNHADRYDRDGDRWVWCDRCDGLRTDGHGMHKSGIGWPAVEIDEGCGPLTFAPRPADTPTTAPQPDDPHGWGDFQMEEDEVERKKEMDRDRQRKRRRRLIDQEGPGDE